MPTNFYIADWHFGHSNILAFDNRPFKDVDEMNRILMENWNKTVSADDTVYVLGDMFWCNANVAIPVLDSLAGQKVLIKGNHDRCNDRRFLSRFTKVDEYLEIGDDARKIVLCHYPIPFFKNHFYDWYHLYGHVHTSFEYNMAQYNKFLMQELYDKDCFMYNVGAMLPYMNYTPRTLDEIIAANSNEKTKGA